MGLYVYRQFTAKYTEKLAHAHAVDTRPSLGIIEGLGTRLSIHLLPIYLLYIIYLPTCLFYLSICLSMIVYVIRYHLHFSSNLIILILLVVYMYPYTSGVSFSSASKNRSSMVELNLFSFSVSRAITGSFFIGSRIFLS